MQKLRTGLLFLLLSATLCLRAQDTTVIQHYINTYKELAIEEMQRTGVPAAIKLAQGIHETMAGTSDLVLKSNNHFGIKCKDTWTGESVTHDDDLRGECFRKYAEARDSYRDHSNFLKSSTRYASLFKLDPTDYAGWAYGLKKAGYATNPKYPVIIIKLIEDYHLQDYTMIALGKMPPKEDKEEVMVTTTPAPVILTPVQLPKKETVAVVAMEEKKPETVVPSIAKPVEKIIAKPQPVYPEGEFKINETRVVFAKKETSFLAMAQQYNVPLARIFEFNDMRETELVNKDQLIYLQRKRKTGNNEFHIVQPDETLFDIAQQEAIRLETLAEYNLLKPDMKPAVGETLYLHTKAQTAPRLALKEDYSLYAVNSSALMNRAAETMTKTPAIENQAAGVISYTVQPKETIYAISKKYEVKIDDIVKWNQLEGYDLKAGQQLKIYK